MIDLPQTFNTDTTIPWYRSPIEKATLNKLMQRSNLRGWIQTLGHLGFFFTTMTAAYISFINITANNWSWSVPLFVLVMFVHGTMGPFMGLVAIHELQHRTVFKTRSLNVFFEQLYAFISWSDFLWYQRSHAAHHRATCHIENDGEVVLPQRFSLRRWQFWLGLLAWNPLVTWTKLKGIWRHAKGRISGAWYKHLIPETDLRLRRQHRNWARFLIVAHTILVCIFIATGHWFLILVFTFGTQYCSWLGFLTGLPQHFGLSANTPDFRLSTRTFTCSPVTAFYYWNMQYHLEHHMYPAVPFHNLGKLRKVIEHDLPPAIHGLLPTWRQLLQIRRDAIADPGYQFFPKIPK